MTVIIMICLSLFYTLQCPLKKNLLPEAVHESKKSTIQNKPYAMQANTGYRTTRRYGNSVELTDCRLLDWSARGLFKL